MNNKKDFDPNSIYGKFEMGCMVRIQRTKEKLLLPLLRCLSKIRIRPNYVSFFSAFTVVATFTLAVYYNQPIIFIIGIWAHLFFDGVDGALARYQKTATSKGTFVDVFGDQFGITFMCIFVAIINIVNIINISVFFVLYTIVIIISLYLLYKKSRFEFVYRPRIFFYYAATIDVLVNIGLTEILVLVSNFVLFLVIILGIYQIIKLNKI